MLNRPVYDQARATFRKCYNRDPDVVAYAPGRVEVLGNHTDYNEGLVLSAAIDLGTFFLAAHSGDAECRVTAGDIMETVAFPCRETTPDPRVAWVNYVKGVYAGLVGEAPPAEGFLGLFLGCIPLGSGLSSSAALEISTALALSNLYGLTPTHMEIAVLGQQAEHRFAGVKCGLLDQISSLYGRPDALVMTDFRSLDVTTIPLGPGGCFLLCDTGTRHALVDGAYNARRKACEAAVSWFAKVLDHPVTALRDVSTAEWQLHHTGLDSEIARRALHPIGENERVQRGRDVLKGGDLAAFGRLMFDSHESSVQNFENSCAELDFIVNRCRQLPDVYGARLSGGGFGGSAVVCTSPEVADAVGRALRQAYEDQFGYPCTIRRTRPSAGASTVSAVI